MSEGIRLLADARGEFRSHLLRRILKDAGGDITLALHLGDRDADFHAPCLQRLEVRMGRKGHLLHGREGTGAQLPLLAQPDFHQLIETAVDQMQRNAQFYRYRAHNIVNLQDYLDYYHLLANAFAQEIQDNGATHALFTTVPHLAYDAVLYQVARALGLKTLVLCQTIFPSRYFSMRRVEDLGSFVDDGRSVEPYPIEKGSAPDLFYMDDRWQKPSPRGQLGARAVMQLLRHLALRDPGKLFRPRYLRDTLARMRDIYGALPDWRDPFAAFFHTNEMAYFEHLAQYEGQTVDLTRKYVYVPLHNQPEMSTSSLGGVFRDQVLMIEVLARHLPPGWLIYVKDNPRQGAFARGPMHFHRLTSIRGVQVVPLDASTHDLSSHAQFVATVTGTAAWEAVRKGRPALVFGNAWYKSLPGIFPYQEGFDPEAIAAFRFPHDALETAMGRIMARCHQGVIEPIYRDMAPDLDEAANADEISRTVLGLLRREVSLTFGAPHPAEETALL
ncbi:hypothetical protein [Tabrizicola aquatica]|uniref:capsular polysaccharide export protein, LipB/KpsS family n=1 Tax=Tabrizicola aquatica TaxID=909926 RepID=UPI000CD239E8|nr:hypothetical protein [Tabrizicola aquatica]